MKLDRVDRLVLVCFVIMVASIVGMVFDFWRLVYYAIPAMTALFMLLGGLNKREGWSRAVVGPAAVFGGLMLVLFVIADALLGSDAFFGGLPAATGVFLYVIWPVTTVAGGLLFAWVYHKWLRHDLDAES